MSAMTDILRAADGNGFDLADNLDSDLRPVLELRLRQYLNPSEYDLEGIVDEVTEHVVDEAIARLSDLDLAQCRAIVRPQDLNQRFESEADYHLIAG